MKRVVIWHKEQGGQYARTSAGEFHISKVKNGAVYVLEKNQWARIGFEPLGRFPSIPKAKAYVQRLVNSR